MSTATVARSGDATAVPQPRRVAGGAHIRRFDAPTRIAAHHRHDDLSGVVGDGTAVAVQRCTVGARAGVAVRRVPRRGPRAPADGRDRCSAAVAWHVADVFWRAFVKGERGIFWGPTSMVPQPRDVQQFWQQMLWFFGKGPRPKYDHFTYWEKFDYWAVLWGTALMGAAGLILWFPEAASHVLPGWMFNVALFVHGAEAALAIGFIFVVHFFNGHLRPGKFPMDLVIFTGVVTGVRTAA